MIIYSTQGKTGRILISMSNRSEMTQRQNLSLWSEDNNTLRPEANLASFSGSKDNREYDISPLSFLQAFYREWSLAMIGPASVPFLIISAFFSGTARIMMMLLSALCLFIGVWTVWKKEREAKLAKQIKLLKESAKNARPNIGVEIQEIYAQHVVRKDGTHPNHLDVYFTLKAHLVNTGRPIAIRRFTLYVNFDKSVKIASETPLNYLAFEYKQTVISKETFLISEEQPVQEALNELSKNRIEHGDNREGWLHFVRPELSGKQIDEIEGVTLCVVDAESNVHKATINKAQWRQTGKLINVELQKFEQELERIESEKRLQNKRIIDGLNDLIAKYEWAEKEAGSKHLTDRCGGMAYRFLQGLGSEYAERFSKRSPGSEKEFLKEIQKEFTC